MRGWYVAAAKGGVLDVLEKTCAQLQDSTALEYMGFTTDFGRGLPGNLSETHEMVKEEDDKGRHAMGIFLSVARHRLGSMMWHFCSWVGLLALAASNSETDVNHCIDVLRLHYRAFLNVVVKAKKIHSCRRLLMPALSGQSSCRMLQRWCVATTYVPLV